MGKKDKSSPTARGGGYIKVKRNDNPLQCRGLTKKENPVCNRFCFFIDSPNKSFDSFGRTQDMLAQKWRPWRGQGGFLIDPPTPFGVGGLNSIEVRGAGNPLQCRGLKEKILYCQSYKLPKIIDRSGWLLYNAFVFV